jgi:hypothetical protein
MTNMGLEHVPQKKMVVLYEKAYSRRARVRTASADPGQVTHDEYMPPVKCRQDVQWQFEA